MPRVFISTFGITPQVVTLAFDELLQEKVQFDELCVIHTDASAAHWPSGARNIVHAAMQQLDGEFTVLQTLETNEFEQTARVRYQPPWAPEPFEFNYRKVCINKIERGKRVACPDANTKADAKAAFNVIFRTVRAYKAQRCEIHMCIAGGRKSMSAFGMGAAQLLFDQQDGLYHLMSTANFERTRAMHEEKRFDLAELIKIPVIFLGSIAPQLTRLLSGGDPFDAVATQESYLLFADPNLKDAFVSGLTEIQQQVLRLITLGLSNDEIAKLIGCGQSTVANNLPLIFEAYCAHIDKLPEEVGSTTSHNKRTYLISEFAAYFRQKGGT